MGLLWRNCGDVWMSITVTDGLVYIGRFDRLNALVSSGSYSQLTEADGATPKKSEQLQISSPPKRK